MRVTLSYFIEPGPGEIGWKDRYRYPSHGLRFKLNAPSESKEEFLKRINKRELKEGEKPETEADNDGWVLGANARDVGSLHSDIWRGSAANLARMNLIGVCPVVGWWRERHHLGRWDRMARYSLVVSISTPGVEADVYTPVAAQVGIDIPAIVEVGWIH
jgi:hypothetical protein